MSSAIERFGAIPELLTCTGQMVINRTTLLDLCLTSKLFNACFTPFLYVEIWFRKGNGSRLLDLLKDFLNNKSLVYTRILDFSVASRSSQDSRMYNDAIKTLLSRIPDLKSFSWEGQPIYDTTLLALHQHCSKLQCLHIAYPDNIEQTLGIAFESNYDHGDGFTELRPLFATQDISLFENLTELKILDIHGDIQRQRRSIVKILIKSPALTMLSLSLNSDTIFRLHESGDSDYLFFFELMISEFVAAGGHPLQLRKLVVGLCVILWEDEPGEPATYLSGLTNLDVLEEAFIFNDGTDSDTAIHFRDPDEIAWCTFTPLHCPKLRTFGFEQISEDARRWAQGIEPGYLRRIKIEENFGENLLDFAALLQDNGSSTKPWDGESGLDINNPIDSMTEDGNFDSFHFPTMNALSIDTLNNSTDIKHRFLDWIKGLARLEQLYLFKWAPVFQTSSDEEYELLGREIALQDKNIRYLKVGPIAWRVWHNDDKKEKCEEDNCRLETLDRFEAREIEAFQHNRLFLGFE